MLERETYPPGVPCWIDISQEDTEAATAFYSGLFGWDFEDGMPPDSPQRYFMARVRGKDVAAVGSAQENTPSPPAWNTYVAVASADETAAKAREAGGKVLMDPFDVGDAGRMAVIADPAGAVFSIWEARENPGARLVNEPNTWNFSGLSTPDPEGAKAFYNAVFGWEIGTFGGEDGDPEMHFFRLPGYADFLEEINPGTKQGMKDMGAPEGFDEAVATLMPPDGDDTPPHWNITFGVADADAMAVRAEELGGKVLVPPVDAPWIRMTVLSDPAGAVFTASQFTPPES